MKHIQKKIVVAVLAGFLIGAIWLVAVRFVTYKSTAVHYHANFALYIDGKRDEFKSFTFYEEVQACTNAADGDPKHRVHMHNQQNSLVHVHEPGVTWGHFFANLGYGLTDNLVKTDEGVYVNKQNGKTLTFMLNGQKVSSAANRIIASEDVLLISYGQEEEKAVKQQETTIVKDAGEFNSKLDPGSCSGSKPLTFLERLKIATGLSGSGH